MAKQRKRLSSPQRRFSGVRRRNHEKQDWIDAALKKSMEVPRVHEHEYAMREYVHVTYHLAERYSE